MEKLCQEEGMVLESKEGVDDQDRFQEEKFIEIMKARLLPIFVNINKQQVPGGAFITLPGISCGVFGGHFGGNETKQIPRALTKVIRQILAENTFSHIKGVVYDAFSTGSLGVAEGHEEVNGVSFVKQELKRNDTPGAQQDRPKYPGAQQDRPQQLAHPSAFGERFKDCTLFSLVAADALSKPGNDLNAGSRATDEGNKHGATNAFSVFTGAEGEYSKEHLCYITKDARGRTTCLTSLEAKNPLKYRTASDSQHAVILTQSDMEAVKMVLLRPFQLLRLLRLLRPFQLLRLLNLLKKKYSVAI
jgi:hypothetical protein